MVVIRAQALRQTEEDDTIKESEQQCGVQPTPLLLEDDKPFVGSEFDSELFLCGQKPDASRVPTISENCTAVPHAPT